MSWARKATILVAALALLSACQVRPLYAPSSQATGSLAGPQAVLAAISIDPPQTRDEQTFRNALSFLLHGGREPAAPRYDLIYRLTIRSQEIAIERGTGTPNAYQLSGSVSFLVKDIGTGQEVFGTNVTAVDSYTRSSQNFANIRARRDAEERLTRVLAELAQARLAAYFATH
jgi:LPS-assembly lipoprotein